MCVCVCACDNCFPAEREHSLALAVQRLKSECGAALQMNRSLEAQLAAAVSMEGGGGAGVGGAGVGGGGLGGEREQELCQLVVSMKRECAAALEMNRSLEAQLAAAVIAQEKPQGERLAFQSGGAGAEGGGMENVGYIGRELIAVLSKYATFQKRVFAAVCPYLWPTCVLMV